MSPTEIVRGISFVLGSLKIPIDLYKGHKNLGRKVKKGLESLKDDLESLQADLESNTEGWKISDERQLQLTELVYDIEDFAESLWQPGASGPFLSAVGMDPREQYVRSIEDFKERIKELEKRMQRSTESKSSEPGGGTDTASSSAAGEYTPEKSLVGISGPKKALLDLLEKPASSEQAGEERPPKVISIVGCPGVGKTALARAVYHHACASDEFQCVVWVEASVYNDNKALLGKILEKVQADLASRANGLKKLSHLPRKAINKIVYRKEDDDIAGALRGILADKRYLVFIDDVQQAEVCDDTENTFPKNCKRSMLIVTTRSRTVVNNVCSSRPGSSYVYTMQCLPPTESEDLLWRKFYGDRKEVVSALRSGAKNILSKCDGLPLALISVAKYLRRTKGIELDGADCAKVGEELGRHLFVGGAEDEPFRELRKALQQCYDSLPQSDYRSCMLYLSTFPRKNHPIKRKSLVRKLIAERLLVADDDDEEGMVKRGQECLEGLVNRCIIEPVQNYDKDFKSYRVSGGIMREFIIHKSKSINLVTLIHEGKVVRNRNGRIRRLSVHCSTKHKVDEVAEKHKFSETVRSLTIFPSEGTGSELLDIKRCRFLRLLDMEGCKELEDEAFQGICNKLVYLKYLGLRQTRLKKIPREIQNLQCLQTLDVRETQDEIQETIQLPEEVITLPRLAFLFGKFVLPKMSNNTHKFLATKSELHTLAGIVVEQEGLDHVVLAAKKLRKVKVWCKDTAASAKEKRRTSVWKKLLSPISQARPRISLLDELVTKKDFVLSLRNCFSPLESVSIDFSQLSQDIHPSDTTEEENCSTSPIRRLKLLGKLDTLSRFTLSQLNNLTKLQLSNTGLAIEFLSTLQHMPDLEYLKLHEDEEGSWDGSFVVHEDGFGSLRRLCFKASKIPKLQFETGSMKRLSTLHLLCPDISQMQVAEGISKSIQNLEKLNEVVLHPSAPRVIVEAWETAAKWNGNRPRVVSSILTSDRAVA